VFSVVFIDTRTEVIDVSRSQTPAEESFETATLPHLRHVARFALSLARDRADADDLVQETYLRALRGWKTFRPGTDARRWLFTICRNFFLSLRHRRRPMVESDDGDLEAMPAVMSQVRPTHDRLARLFDHLDVGPAIERAIGRLPEPHHSILVLVDLEGHSYDEAAAILDVAPGTVRSRLHRARRMVQEVLMPYAEDVGVRCRA
jgi:RNA polymerase sigma-70 factor (ECF subfamily)